MKFLTVETFAQVSKSPEEIAGGRNSSKPIEKGNKEVKLISDVHNHGPLIEMPLSIDLY